MANSLEDLGTITDFFPLSPNWAENIGFAPKYNQVLHAFSGSVTRISPFADDVARLINFQLLLSTKEMEYNLIEFFTAMKGRLGKFWLQGPPTFFTLAEIATSGSTSIVVVDNGYQRLHKSYERVYIKLNSGDLITRKINSTTGPVAEKLTLNVATVLDREIAPSDVVCFGRLYLTRFTKDRLDLDMLSDTVSRCSVEFIELIEEYP